MSDDVNDRLRGLLAGADVPTYPAPRRGTPEEEACWADLPVPHQGHLSYTDHVKDNAIRASWAAAALKPYGELVTGDPTTEEPKVILGDLLADLRHLADAMGINYEDAEATGAAHYYLDLRGDTP